VEARRLSWNIGAGILYTLFLSIMITLINLISKLFYPPFPVDISPLLSIYTYPTLSLIEILMLILLVVFAYPIKGTMLNIELEQVRNLALFGAIGYLFLSMIPYAVDSPYPQTFIGLVVVFILFNGIFSGVMASLRVTDEKREISKGRTH
jgi:hypothetical protein